MMNFGHFETEMQIRYPDSLLYIRNMCDGGDTPGFRPHASRPSPWAFPGAEKFQTELAKYSDSQGHFETPDQWITRLQADIILAFFGYNESYENYLRIDNPPIDASLLIPPSLNLSADHQRLFGKGLNSRDKDPYAPILPE